MRPPMARCLSSQRVPAVRLTANRGGFWVLMYEPMKLPGVQSGVSW